MDHDKQVISNKAPFVGAVIFFGLLIWTSQAPTLPDNPLVLYLKIFQMAIYGLLGVASVAAGVYQLKSGGKTIDPPRTSHIIGAMVASTAMAAIAAAAIWYNLSAQMLP